MLRTKTGAEELRPSFLRLPNRAGAIRLTMQTGPSTPTGF